MEEHMLPQKPSALIRLALEDLKKVEEDKRYVIDMGEWHHPAYKPRRCHVCLAGAVLAKTLGEPVTRETVPSPSRHGPDSERLEALNFFRQGLVYSGIWKMNRGAAEAWLKRKGSYARRDIPDYVSGKSEFHAAMNVMADELEVHGL